MSKGKYKALNSVKVGEILRMEPAPVSIVRAPPEHEIMVPAERKGDWIQTYSGVQFWPLDARPEEVRIEDIAHALSNLCRFGGHTNTFYSVAQHCCLVAQHCPPEHRFAGLLHDATEAYLVDVPSPIKQFLVGYKDIEAGLARVIGERFGVCLEPLPPDVHEQDARALWTEKRDIKGPQPARWGIPEMEPYPTHIQTWTPAYAEKAFLRMFAGLRTSVPGNRPAGTV